NDLRDNGDISGLRFSPDGRFLISASLSDNTVRFWRLPDGVLVKCCRKEVFSPTSLAFPANAAFWVCGRRDGSVFAASNPYVRNAASNLRHETYQKSKPVGARGFEFDDKVLRGFGIRRLVHLAEFHQFCISNGLQLATVTG